MLMWIALRQRFRLCSSSYFKRISKQFIEAAALMAVIFVVTLFMIGPISCVLAEEPLISSETDTNHDEKANDWVAVNEFLRSLSAPSWSQQVVTFLTVINTVVAAAFTSYIDNSKKSTRGFLHTDISNGKGGALILRMLSYISTCLTVASHVSGYAVLVIIFGTFSMVITGILLWKSISLSFYSDKDIIEFLKRLLGKDDSNDTRLWQHAFITGFENSIHKDKHLSPFLETSDICFFQKCIYFGWEHECESLHCTEIYSSRLFDKDHSRQRKYFEMVCYVQQYMISKFDEPKQLRNYVLDVIDSVEMLRIEITDTTNNRAINCSQECNRARMLTFDLYAYTTYLNMILKLNFSRYKTSKELLMQIARNMIHPLTRNHADVEGLFEWTRALAVRYACIGIENGRQTIANILTAEVLYSAGINSQMLTSLALTKQEEIHDLNPIIGMEKIPLYENTELIRGKETIIPWYSLCKRLFETLACTILEGGQVND